MLKGIMAEKINYYTVIYFWVNNLEKNNDGFVNVYFQIHMTIYFFNKLIINESIVHRNLA